MIVQKPMADPSALDFLRSPSNVPAALGLRLFHFLLQPCYLVRVIHVSSLAAFFGGIAVLDLRLSRRVAVVQPPADIVLACL